MYGDEDIFFDTKNAALDGDIKRILWQTIEAERAEGLGIFDSETVLSLEDVRPTIPSREVVDMLIQHYLRTFGAIFRIIPLRAFYSAYDHFFRSRGPPSLSLMVLLLPMMAIGARFVRSGYYGRRLYSLARQWISFVKATLTTDPVVIPLLTTLQCRCLLVLATQLYSSSRESLWIAASSMFQSAILMGLHDDRRAAIIIPDAELRQQLWLATTELTVQASLGCGVSPLMPVNIPRPDRGKNEEAENVPLSSRGKLDGNSIKGILSRSFATRLQIAQALSDGVVNMPYEKVLDLSKHIGQMISEIHRLSSRVKSTEQADGPNPFTYSMLSLMLRRFMLALHWPWLLRVQTDPRYYYSRKVCLDTALALARLSDNISFRALVGTSHGMFRTVSESVPMALCVEIMLQVNERGLDSETFQRQTSSREYVLACLAGIQLTVEEGLQSEPRNVQYCILLGMAIAQAEAMHKGTASIKGVILRAAEHHAIRTQDLVQRPDSRRPALRSDSPPSIERREQASFPWPSELFGEEFWLSLRLLANTS